MSPRKSPRKSLLSSPATGARRAAKHAKSGPRLFTLKVSIIGGLMSDAFFEKNPVVSRTIQIRGDQTLYDLHYAIFDALDRYDEHMYEFQVGGKRPMDRKALRYILPMVIEDPYCDEEITAGDVTETTIESIGLKTRQNFYYWFDFGDDWWHKISVVAIEDKAPPGKYPLVTERVGESPPQYMDLDEEDEE